MTPVRKQSSSWFARIKNALSSTAHKSASPYSGVGFQTYLQSSGKASWMTRDYGKFSDEAYIKNVIAYRSIHMIASSAASIDWMLSEQKPSAPRRIIQNHPLLKILRNPNPMQGGAEFFESVYSYRLISGNSFLQMVGPEGGMPKELYALRPDRVAIIPGRAGIPAAYRYMVKGKQAQDSYVDFPVNRINGRSQILHLKTFHPLDDWYGLSPIEAAAYSIDQHNQSGAWNQALLQNGARPSGALVVKTENSMPLSEDQYHRLKLQMDEQFSGSHNAGRPILLEGGLDWREMSLTPKDMDYINAKHSSARDIALAFGVPPQLLGIPGDNTYSNLAEARLALWEQTIMPLVDQTCDAINQWLVNYYGDNLHLTYDTNSISALGVRKQQLWEQVSKATFLTDDEKRLMVGLPPLKKAKPL